MLDHKSGKNPLYNVLSAYGFYDEEVGYCQGMNIVAAWLLKYYQEKIDNENGFNSYGLETNLDYNEIDSWYTLIYICHEKQWREIYKPGMQKIVNHLTLLSEVLSTGYEDVYKHLQEQLDDHVNLELVFWSQIMTIFISDLMDTSPQIATHIFDAFLIDGEMVIYTLFIKFIENLQDEILSRTDEDLNKFMKSEMPGECLKKVKMHELLDFYTCIESEQSNCKA